MIMQAKRDEMIADLNDKGVHVQIERYTRNLKSYRLPIYKKAEFLRAIGADVPDDLSEDTNFEVYDAYPLWLHSKYPNKAEFILEAEFEASSKAFNQVFDNLLNTEGLICCVHNEFSDSNKA